MHIAPRYLCALLALPTTVFAQAQFQPLPRMELPSSTHNSFSIDKGDLNGDGFPDVVLCNLSGSVFTQLLINDGRGNFKDLAATNLPASSRRFAGAIALIDADRDRDLDIVLGGRSGSCNLYLNDGKGRFTDASANMPATSESFYDIAVADIDLDGDQDLALANPSTGSGSDRVFLNDGTGKFTDITGATTGKTFPAGANGSWGVVAADLDGDVDIDLVFTSSTSTKGPIIFINQGVLSGQFKDETATRFPAGGMLGRKILAFDADGDRDLDLYFGNYTQQDRLFLNNGRGVFTDASSTHMPGGATSTYFPAAGDVDGDGDLDVVVGHWNGNGAKNQILLNDGKGRFTDATATRSSMSADPTTTLVLADFDGDGDLDAFHGNWTRPPTVAFNHHRHAYAATQATIGQNWVLDFHSAPGYATQLSIVRGAVAAGILPTPIALPAVAGKLALDPALTVLLPAQTIAAPGGKTSYTIPVPNNTILQGVQFFAQGLIIHGADTGFTNPFGERVR